MSAGAEYRMKRDREMEQARGGWRRRRRDARSSREIGWQFAGGAGGRASPSPSSPSRQSSSYIPIRGWHSLISHIITLVRGALRSLHAAYARSGCCAAGEATGVPTSGSSSVGVPLGDRFTATLGTDSPVATAAAAARSLLAPDGPGRHPECARARNNPGRCHMFARSSVRSFEGGLAGL
jgi:hypothetical protein